MNAVIYYSNTGESQKIATYLAQKAEYALIDLTRMPTCVFDNAILVFPVHCQNLPAAVKKCLLTITAKNLAIIATYGKMRHGNVLWEAQKLWQGNVIAAAYVPTKHTYLPGDTTFTQMEKLDAIIHKFSNPTPITVPRARKSIFAGVFDGARSRVGVKLRRTKQCADCNECATVCPNNAIKRGKPNGKCIRCLKCVHHCPQKALVFSLRLPMRLYLKKRKVDELKIYV